MRTLATDRQRLGREAEDAAIDLLQSAGVAILLRNYRCRIGELDIVGTLAPDVLLIVEVRARSRQDYGGGAASIDAGKRRHIVRTTQHLLMMRPELTALRARFDVVDVQVQEGRLRCEWLKAAFAVR